MASPKTIFIVAGGTGGHVFPAKRVAQKFIEEGFKIIWIGTSRGPEKNICKDLGISFIQVPLYGFRGKNLITKLKALFAFFISGFIFYFKSSPLDRKNYPMLVFGGYVSLISFFYFKGPVFLQEQNTIPGSVSKLLFTTNKVSKIFCGFEKTKIFFEELNKKYIKIINTGNPIGKIKKTNERNLDLNELNILVMGGSQGSKFLNEFVSRVLIEIKDNFPIKIKHQCGLNNVSYLEKIYSSMEDDISVTEFIKNIDDAYQWADLVISRSGALTVSELIASRSAAILVPLKISIDDHQKENANYLFSNNSAWILEETDSFSVELKSLLVSILKNRESLLQKKQSISQIEIKDSETIIFNEVNAWYR